MVQRLTYTRSKSYATKSNRIVGVKTPGGKLATQYVRKLGSSPVCGDTGKRLHGIPARRPFQLKSLAKRKRSVSRAYGGVLSAGAVRTRILRAFLVEESALVVAVAKARAAAMKKTAEDAKKTAGKKTSKAAPKKSTKSVAKKN